MDLPDNNSKVRIIWTDIPAGQHTITMNHELTTNVSFDSKSEKVSSAFWIRDLRTRLFIEQYVPTNLEYDQYQMTLDVTFQGRRPAIHELMHNGTISSLGTNSYRIEYPEWYTASGPYFHTFPKGKYSVRRFSMKSVNGNTIPFTIYASGSSRVNKFVKYAK